MIRGEVLRRGAAAAEDAVEILLRRSVRKALDPLKPRDFEVIMDRLARKVRGTAGVDEARAMAAALDVLDVRWASMSDAAVDAVVKAANAALRRGVEKIPARIEAVLEVEGPGLAASTRASAKRTFGLDITGDLQMRDKVAERFARTFTGNYVRDEMGRRVDAVSEKARGVVARGMAKGLGSDQIGRTLRSELGTTVARGDGYWRVVAGSYASHARTFSELGAFEDAGIESWRFEAVLDEATTQVCRYYHGRTFSTESATAQVDRMMELEDPEDIRRVSPWVREGRNDEGEEFLYVKRGDKRVRIATVERSSVGSKDDVGEFSRGKSSDALVKLGAVFPPLHGLCRSMIVPA
jgi:hypothetical protein